ncbi:MAG: helix-turn-helix domain-containing protein, partial [Tissierellia bacterium]|nr:helix-turn-helix domain-containing protein [Tissierellia bacterium]
SALNYIGHDNYNDIGDCGINEYLESLEREIIIKALENYNNNVSRAAQYLKIKRQTLQHKIKKYNIG